MHYKMYVVLSMVKRNSKMLETFGLHPKFVGKAKQKGNFVFAKSSWQ
jgi:hypothetical protein